MSEKTSTVVEETAPMQREGKAKKSKKWKRKFSRGESASARLESNIAPDRLDVQENENLAEQGQSREQEGKEKFKERKSIKGKITGKLRKLSRTEKKLNTEPEDHKRSTNDNEDVVKNNEENVESTDNQCVAAEQVNECEVAIEEGGINKEKAEENEPCDVHEIVDHHEDSVASQLETSTERQAQEEEEKRRSKVKFDAVICELAKVESKYIEEVHGKQDEVTVNEPLEAAEDNKKTEEDEDIDGEQKGASNPSTSDASMQSGTVNVSHENKDKLDENQQSSNLLNDDQFETVMEDPNENPVSNEFIVADQKNEAKNDIPVENQENKEITAKESEKPKQVEISAPTKDGSHDLSQKIARKAVGKVCNRYKQVQLTRTYCTQCCTVM